MDSRTPTRPETIIEDLYGNQINSLLDDLHKKIQLKEYEYSIKGWILLTIKNLDYNTIVLNEVKRRYLQEGWGNIFYNFKEDTNEITYQLYFPQIKSTV